jgi:hypothetical protein
MSRKRDWWFSAINWSMERNARWGRREGGLMKTIMGVVTVAVVIVMMMTMRCKE